MPSLGNGSRLGPRHVPGHEKLVAFFGLRLQLVVAIVVAGVVGGAFGAAYLEILARFQDLVGPDNWSEAGQFVVLGVTGIIVTICVRVLGHPADVELLVDNIHVPIADDPSPSRLRSLIPVSLLCIGTGGTLGPEAPVVTTTGSVAHRLASRADLDKDDIRVVALTGMAAGFAVLFGAPIGGALFALEIPHRRGVQYHEALVPASIGAVIGVAISGATGGNGLAPIWSLPIVNELHAADLVWAVVAGIAGTVIAVAFTAMAEIFIHIAEYISSAWRPLLGGLILAGLAVWTPYALTNGEYEISPLVGKVAVATLVVAAIAKLVAAAVCVAFGWRGGFIIPLFFVGFCVGRIVAPWLPGATEWAFVVSVMVAANVGVTKTPLGSTLVVTEMAGVTVLPSTLIAALVCMVLTSPVGLIESQRERVDMYDVREKIDEERDESRG